MIGWISLRGFSSCWLVLNNTSYYSSFQKDDKKLGFTASYFLLYQKYSKIEESKMKKVCLALILLFLYCRSVPLFLTVVLSVRWTLISFILLNIADYLILFMCLAYNDSLSNQVNDRYYASKNITIFSFKNLSIYTSGSSDIRSTLYKM